MLKFSTLTNFAETPELAARTDARPVPSRGALVRDFLASPPDVSAEAYSAELRPRLGEYAGCNLLCGELTAEGRFEMGYASNRGGAVEGGGPVAEGGETSAAGRVVGLSNSTLEAGEDPLGRWPKVRSGCSEVERLIEETRDSGPDGLIAGLWQILRSVPLALPRL